MMPLQVLEEAGDKAVLVDFYGEGSSIPPLPSLSFPLIRHRLYLGK